MSASSILSSRSPLIDESRGRTALVIEDNPAQAEIMKALLESAGFQVYLAADGESGLELVLSTRPAIVVLDLFMPKFDGRHFLSKFRREADFSGIPVIVVTASQSVVSIVEICAMGARAVVTKPIDQAAFLQKAMRVYRTSARR